MRGVDENVVREFQNLVVQAIEEHAGELRWRVLGRQVGAANVAEKQSVSSQHGPGQG